MHIVDELILERGIKLQSVPALWRLIKPGLFSLLGYSAARRITDLISPLNGFDAFAAVSDELDLQINSVGIENIPKTGRCVIVCNHPTGLADGIAVFDLLRDHRPDMVFMANADALRVVPNGEDIVIPVEWVLAKRSRAKARNTLSLFRQAMTDERSVVIFPAGSLANLTMNGLVDKPWESSAFSLARKYQAPIIPVNITGRNSLLYYLFCILSAELRDITLFHELLNKQDKLFQFNIGSAIMAEDLPNNTEQAIIMLRQKATEHLAITE
jgi:putative hemolysin